MKVLICDYLGISAQWLKEISLQGNFEIVGTLTPDSDKNLLAENSWDYLLIFENGARNFFNTMAQFMKIPPKKIIYALDLNSWAEHPAAVYELLNPARGGIGVSLADVKNLATF